MPTLLVIRFQEASTLTFTNGEVGGSNAVVGFHEGGWETQFDDCPDDGCQAIP